MADSVKILHVMPDEKFIDYYIEQTESICPGRSAYWITIQDTLLEPTHVKSKLVRKVEWSSDTIVDRVMEANEYDRIVLHGFLQDHMYAFITKLRKEAVLIWMFWGGDGYGFTRKWWRWYLPITLKWKRRNLRRDISFARYIVRRLNLFFMSFVKSIRVKEIIRRIDICCTWVKYDYEMIKHINPDMKWMYYSYFNRKQLGLDEIVYQSPNFSRIWLGNSATDTNNHFDALSYLDEINWAGDIVAPLSYGNNQYSDAVIAYGKDKFGERFVPITKFMPVKEYQECLNSCGIVWMNHIRQQAAGNTIAALYLGKVLILNRESNLYKTYSDWGLDVFTYFDLRRVEDLKIDFRKAKLVMEKEMAMDHNLRLFNEVYDVN